MFGLFDYFQIVFFNCFFWIVFGFVSIIVGFVLVVFCMCWWLGFSVLLYVVFKMLKVGSVCFSSCLFV